MIVVPRRKRKATNNEAVGKAGKEGWVVCNCECEEEKEDTSPVPPSPSPPPPTPKRAPKAVDEDLYKISPQLLQSKPTRKGVKGFFSSCLLPTCAS